MINREVNTVTYNGYESKNVGPGIYVENAKVPKRFYQYVEPNMYEFGLSQCASVARYTTKPLYTANNWMRTSNHACAEIAEYQIGSDIDVSRKLSYSLTF